MIDVAAVSPLSRSRHGKRTPSRRLNPTPGRMLCLLFFGAIEILYGEIIGIDMP